ncbi:MAG: hypothetical protein IPO90_02490 [Flavobacteriales bacterium]|nr:hypothetical protein [Flavobacteriales bacterium]
MGFPNTLRACAIVGTLVLTSAAGVLAQTFQINGRVKVDGGALEGTKVVVYKNGEKQRTVNSGLTKFSLDLDLNADYILSFEKEGFVSKKLSFDTHAPAEAIANGFTPFEFAVNIFKQYDDVNSVVFNQPVGMIRFSSEADDFDYDTDYTKSIQSELEKAIEEVAKKQAEEKEKDAIAAKQEEDEAKARAKAEALQAKADAESAKLKAKQDKEAAETAKREQMRLDAEAKKAEQERLAAVEKKPKEQPAPKAEPKPKPEPKKKEEPAPVQPPVLAKVKAPKPPPEPPPVKFDPLITKLHEGSEARRSNGANEMVEASPVQRAKENGSSEAKPALPEKTIEVARHEELIVEPNSVTTRIDLDNGKAKTEYRKIVHKYGSVFYFKDGQSCTKLTYENEALAETR